MAVDYESGSIPVEKLKLDIDNPRLLHEVLTGNAPTTQSEIEDSITGDPQFRGLLKSIKKTGVQNGIWVSPLTDGSYLVREGNRRTTCLRMLLREGPLPPVV